MCGLCGCEFATMRSALGVRVRLCEPCATEVDDIVSRDAVPAQWVEVYELSNLIELSSYN